MYWAGEWSFSVCLQNKIPTLLFSFLFFLLLHNLFGNLLILSLSRFLCCFGHHPFGCSVACSTQLVCYQQDPAAKVTKIISYRVLPHYVYCFFSCPIKIEQILVDTTVGTRHKKTDLQSYKIAQHSLFLETLQVLSQSLLSCLENVLNMTDITHMSRTWYNEYSTTVYSLLYSTIIFTNKFRLILPHFSHKHYVRLVLSANYVQVSNILFVFFRGLRHHQVCHEGFFSVKKTARKLWQMFGGKKILASLQAKKAKMAGKVKKRKEKERRKKVS